MKEALELFRDVEFDSQEQADHFDRGYETWLDAQLMGFTPFTQNPFEEEMRNIDNQIIENAGSPRLNNLFADLGQKVEARQKETSIRREQR